MTTLEPQQSQAPRTAARRRQRSTRLVVAVALLVLAALLVAAAVASGAPLLTSLAAVAAVVLGGAATKITHSELSDARLEAARDRAFQARDYAELTERRTAENVKFATDMRAKIAAREEVISGLESALATAQRQLVERGRKLTAESRRAQQAEDDLGVATETAQRLEASLGQSEERAAEAIVRVAELEAELDVLRAELVSWQAAAAKENRNSA